MLPQPRRLPLDCFTWRCAMKLLSPLNRTLVPVFLLLFAASLYAQEGPPAPQDNESDREIKVRTYSMNSGNSLSGILNSRSPAELAAIVGQIFTRVQAGNPPERIDAIANQIATASPDIVGLQKLHCGVAGHPFTSLP